MKHADRLAERILFLDGLPNFQALGRLHIGENVEEILRADLELEMEALAQLKGAIAHCETVRDYVSRDLFSEILENEEQHVDTLEQQFEMIERMGLQNYVQLQSRAGGRLDPAEPLVVDLAAEAAVAAAPRHQRIGRLVEQLDRLVEQRAQLDHLGHQLVGKAAGSRRRSARSFRSARRSWPAARRRAGALRP